MYPYNSYGYGGYVNRMSEEYIAKRFEVLEYIHNVLLPLKPNILRLRKDLDNPDEAEHYFLVKYLLDNFSEYEGTVKVDRDIQELVDENTLETTIFDNIDKKKVEKD